MYGFSNLSWDILAPLHLGDLAEVQVFQRAIIRRRNWSHRVKYFFDVEHRNSCFLAGWRTQTMRHLFFTALPFISVSEELALSRYTARDGTFWAAPHLLLSPGAVSPPEQGTVQRCPLPKLRSCPCAGTVCRKSCELHCRGGTWAFLCSASSKSLSPAPSAGTDVPLPCLHQKPSILSQRCCSSALPPSVCLWGQKHDFKN